MDKDVGIIKKSLIEQLDKKGITNKHYLSLIDDYIEFWNIKNKLQDDIGERGVVSQYHHGGGQSGFKKNDSISELVKVNNQMLKILSDLGIRGADNHVEVIDDLL